MKEEGSITLTTSGQRRLLVLNQLEAGVLVSAEAAQLLNLSVRQLRRLHGDYRRRRGGPQSRQPRAPAPQRSPPCSARRVVELATTRHAGFNQQHLTEMLAEEEDIRLWRSTAHQILKAAGVPAPRRRRPLRHRCWCDHYPREGMLIQLDASRHDWLEGRGPILSLLGVFDDATGRVPWACFPLEEDAQGYFEVMRETVRRLGIPMAAYTDRHSIFVRPSRRNLRSSSSSVAGACRPSSRG